MVELILFQNPFQPENLEYNEASERLILGVGIWKDQSCPSPRVIDLSVNLGVLPYVNLHALMPATIPAQARPVPGCCLCHL